MIPASRVVPRAIFFYEVDKKYETKSVDKYLQKCWPGLWTLRHLIGCWG